MTASDVIDPVNALPQSERAKGHDFVHALGVGRPPVRTAGELPDAAKTPSSEA